MTQAIARVNGVAAIAPAAGGRRRFKTELDALRERMRGVGLGYDAIAREIARRYRSRPREAYRLAYGWTLMQTAAQFNALAAKQGTDPRAIASMTGPHLCEIEKWPESRRKPSVYVLTMLARMYETDVSRLLDLADYEHLAPQDRFALLGRPHTETPSGPGLVSPVQARELPPHAVIRHTLPGTPANRDGLALSLPFVPGRVMIEISGPEVQAAPSLLSLVPGDDGPGAG